MIRTAFAMIACAVVMAASRDAAAVLVQWNNPFGGAKATALVGHDASDGKEWIAWTNSSTGMCIWNDLGVGGFSNDFLLNAGPNGDSITIIDGSGSWPVCGFTLTVPNYNGHHFDINGGAGSDWVKVGSGNTYIYGNGGNDFLWNGGGAALVLDGGNGNDSLQAGNTNNGQTSGGANDDCLQVGESSTNASMSCGSGTDKWSGPGTRPADCEAPRLSCCTGFSC